MAVPGETGEVWLLYTLQESAVAAKNVFDGRWFDMRQIKADFVRPPLCV